MSTDPLHGTPPTWPTQPSAPAVDDEPSEKSEKKNKKSGKGAERRRGVETLFRVTYQNHISLSQLADQKAGILISINGIIISVLIGLLTPRLASWSWTLLPSVALVAGCISSLWFAVLGSRPRIDRTPVTLDDVRRGQGNLLFFGHFSTMPLPEFQLAVRALGKDRKLLHDSLSRQLYLMGESLLQKYRYLQLAYTTFLGGIGVAAALFAAMLLGLMTS